MTTRLDVVQQIIGAPRAARNHTATAFAPANIALCKYWGKRNEDLNLPVTSSLSISLGKLGSEVTLSESERNTCELNGQPLAPDSKFSLRAHAFLDLFRPAPDACFSIAARNTIPTAAGFASSASGFAAIVLALDRLFDWKLGARECSILARLGSGSAARSVYRGFVEWRAGARPDGMDCVAEPLAQTWPDLRLGLLVITEKEKGLGSRTAMKRTVETCELYKSWPTQVAQDLAALKIAIAKHDFGLLGRTAESNALAMHATMIATWPPVLYWLPESVAAMNKIWGLREDGLPLYFTMDAGPNMKLIFLESSRRIIEAHFPGLQVVNPWAM